LRRIVRIRLIYGKSSAASVQSALALDFRWNRGAQKSENSLGPANLAGHREAQRELRPLGEWGEHG
jgi:hypothetical protein